jgi:hypothetical protein
MTTQKIQLRIQTDRDIFIKLSYLTDLYDVSDSDQCHSIHSHPLYFICPDLLVTVCETSCEIRG